MTRCRTRHAVEAKADVQTTNAIPAAELLLIWLRQPRLRLSTPAPHYDESHDSTAREAPVSMEVLNQLDIRSSVNPTKHDHLVDVVHDDRDDKCLFYGAPGFASAGP